MVSLKSLYVDSPEYENFLAENISLLIKNLSGDYSSILAPATTNGKNYMPRVAAFLDVAQISDISSVESNDTFKDLFMQEVYCNGNLFRRCEGNYSKNYCF